MRRLPALLAALAMVALAACASSSPSGGSSGSPVRLGFSAWPGWFPWQVAQEKGIFQAHGVNVKLTYFESYTDSLNALSSGNLDANSQTLNDTISSVASGSPQSIVLVNDNSTGNDQIIVGPAINRVEDLRGRNIGVEQGTVDHYLLYLGLARAGMSPADVVIQPLETGAAAAAFASGRLDAVGAFAPFTTKALERPGSKAQFTSSDFPGAIPDHLVFGRGFVAKRPAEVQKLVDAWFDTLAWIKANPAEATAIMARRAGVSVDDYETYNRGTTLFSLDENLLAFQPGTTSRSLDFNARQISRFLVDTKLIDSAPDLSGLFDDTYVKARAAKP